MLLLLFIISGTVVIRLKLRLMENKETIKHRMYKNAARLWDVKNIENLDPLVKLLIEALASEVYKLSTEINNIEIRLLERIALLLTPDMLIIPQPAHMIMAAQPVEDKLIVDKLTTFYYDDPYKNRTPGSLNFRPIEKFSLVKGYVNGIICGGSYYTVDNHHNKEMLARSIKRSEVLNNTIWVGLDLSKQVKNLEDLSFFLDFPNISEQKTEYLPLLSFSQWTHNNEAIKTETGISVKDKDDKEQAGTFFSQYDLLNMLDNKILNHYNQNFITIKDKLPNNHSEYTKIPTELEDFFLPEIKGAIEKPLLWLKIKFPPNFGDSILSDITVSINSFPVANKELRTLFSKSKKVTNIIPLSTLEREYFLSVSSVRDEFDNSYEFLPYKSEDRPSFGTYSLKRGGVERFDTRDANEYISNLIDLLRDESVAFSLLGKDYLIKAVDDIKTKIAVMELKLREVNRNKEINSYLIVDSEDASENIFVEYWTTNCEFGNNVKAGTLLKADMNVFVEKDSTIALTPSSGGRSIPKTNNKLDMYKYILTTRDRIFTSEDIVNFCYAEFGDYFSSVEVKKGVKISDKPKEGLIRTIDVYASLKSEFGRFSENKQEIQSRLLKLLTEKSPDTFNYRIFI